jgi:hypothetical protein
MRDGLNFSSLGVQLSALIILWTGCVDATRPTDPPAAPPAPAPVAPPAPAPVAPPAAPPHSGPGVSYERVSPSFIPAASRYVLYDDNNTFSLQYGAPNGGSEYPGRYVRTDSAITFQFDGWSVVGPWLAQGTIHGDSLTVKYNDVMLWTDFEDGLYVRSPGR